MAHGGKRAGAGRKPNVAQGIKRKTALKLVAPEIKIVRDSVGGKAVTAALILASIDEGELWRHHLADPLHSLEALKYLTDRRDGKAAQSLNVNKTITRTPEQRLARFNELIAIATGKTE